MDALHTTDPKTWLISVTGLVQGVGFRPFVYRIAIENSITGWVLNTNENVQICATAPASAFEKFLFSLQNQAPAAASIESLQVNETSLQEFASFTIHSSRDVSEEVTEVSPDIAVCSDCLADMRQPGSRYNYAFVNCTNCGPRFTIIRDLPYDRAATTMSGFHMCPACGKEYGDILDRRFHAQPTACRLCGPEYELYEGHHKSDVPAEKIPGRAAACLDSGAVVLVKGLGGMHLACDAFQELSVSRLRNLKNREGKPFAVMFRDIQSLSRYAEISDAEEQAITSWRRPIVLLQKKVQPPLPELPAGLTSGLSLIGVMLPYMPVHHLIFDHLKTDAIVLTSGNFSNEPILTINQEALDEFGNRVDLLLLNNRDIHNRTDDSVVRIMSGKERILRRSRGYAPAPVRMALNTEGIVAFGAELTNCFCMGKGTKAFLSQHIGDLQSAGTASFYEETLQRFIRLFRVSPSLAAVDMHPEYVSTRTGLSWEGMKRVQVQHHHAHIASCMAEHHLDEEVIGVAFDGTGYGTDGHTWGSEFFICNLIDFKRVSHFEYIPMPGGDRAAEEPWRMALSWLHRVFGQDLTALDLPVLRQTEPEKREMILQMIERNINSPLTCGAGRLFDCAASLLGLVHTARFHAEGPMLLESVTAPHIRERYAFTAGPEIGLTEVIRGMVSDMASAVPVPEIAAKFHNTIIYCIFETVSAIRANSGLNKVVLSGGVFQNKYLLEGTVLLLQENKFEIFTHATVPANDGGIALGQLAVAAKRRESQCV
jgi:hydrogenase maturation protein HypF